MEYEPVIGLEVHVQLATATKMFTRVPYAFGAEPNSLTDPMVLALPGTLPVMNKAAVEKAIQVGILCHCRIADLCKWDRKNYWYPDSPKNYQISQYDQPICEGGWVEIELPGPSRKDMGEHKQIELTRIHLEEDVGKLTHFEQDSIVDLNRAGVPLLEIVTEPVIASAEEAFAFLTALRMMIRQAGISSCDMEKGQLRCDANISVRPAGTKQLGTKVELKNMNSISGVRDGLRYEIARQLRLAEEDRLGEIVQETRRWNAEGGFTTSMRRKEESHDYRYFPDPDLLPVRISAEWREVLAKDLPERPFERQSRYMEKLSLPYTAATVLAADLELAGYFEAVLEETGKSLAPAAANWIVNDLQRALKTESEEDAEEAPASPNPAEALSPARLAELLKLVEGKVISTAAGREVLSEMLQGTESAEAIVERKGLKQQSDAGELEALCQQVIEGDPKAVERIRGGNLKAINALKGGVMKATKGRANPAVVDEVLKRLLGV